MTRDRAMLSRWSWDKDWLRIHAAPQRSDEVDSPILIELSPCRYCDSPEFEVRDDRTIDFWGVYCLDCGSYLGEIGTLEALVWASHLRGYRRGWVYQQYLNFYLRPNLVELQEVEYILGYKSGWAEHEYERLYGEVVQREEPQVRPVLRLSESGQIYRKGTTSD